MSSPRRSLSLVLFSLIALVSVPAIRAQSKTIPITIRDFNASHADFEETKGTCGVDGNGVKGMVQDTLDAQHKPIKAANSPCPNYDIHTWFRDDPAVNRRYCLDLPLDQVANAVNTFQTPARFAQDYFPIDSVPDPNPPHNPIKAPDPVTPGKAGETFAGGHNFHFCMEMHATFKYRGGEVFDFKGDDDLWVFVNNHLALDLGGLQNNGAGQVNLDAQKDALKIAVDNYYNFDFFFCERQTTGSHLQVTSSIDIIPPPAPGLHIADENLNVIRSGDTLPLDLGSAAKIFKAVKIETQTQTLDCNNLTSQIKTPAQGNWIFNNAGLPAGTQVSISPAGLVPGPYKLVLESAGVRDSIWIRVSDMPKAPAPVAAPPGQAFTGNLQVTLTDALPGATIRYTTDGTEPTASSPVYAGPLTLTATTTLKAMAEKAGYANSDVMTQNYVTTLAKAARGYYLDRDGDGRIETAVLVFDANFTVAPKQMTFTDPFDRTKSETVAAGVPGPAGAKSVLVALKPFTPGTGFAADILAGIAADAEFAAQGVLMDDSVGPVAKTVKSFPSATPGRSPAVEIEFSEPVPLDVASGIFPLEIKRGQGVVDNAGVQVVSIEMLSPSRYRIVFAPDSKYPVPGDSVRIAPARPVKDALGNRSDMRYFIPVSGDPPRANGDLNVGLVKGVTNGPLQISIRPVPNPVVVHGEHTCVNCDASGIKEALPTQEPGKISEIGPTWKVMTKYPFQYSMRFYDNLGQFVNVAEGKVGVEDFEKLRATEKVGDSVLVQLTFLPLSHDGSAIGTGAYIMRGLLQIQDQQGLKGSQGETITLVPTERTIISRFGFVRAR
ncbi:MAG: fibro-slime family protein [Fibrobacteres bacterium]|nr:fibro-slime family protein [Fibrobacterota bacterium]